MIAYIRGLDGLRAFAIIFVVIHHSHFLTDHGSLYQLSEMLGNGVDLFFIVSGFLITNILLNAKGEKHFFKNFYLRRILRIVPLYYFILSLNFFIIPLINHPSLDKLKNAAAWPYWLFLSNYYIAAKGKFENGLIDLSWSLSVEEQFYIFWSTAVYLLGRKQLKKLSLAILIFCPILRFILLHQGVNNVAIHVMSITRMDTLMMGALLALILKDSIIRSRMYLLTLITSLGSFILLTNSSMTYTTIANYTLIGIAYASVLGLALNGHSLILKVLEYKPFALIGLYSYGIYLFHNPIQKALREPISNFLQKYSFEPIWGQLLFYFIVLIISVALSSLSFNFYESKWLKLKTRFNN